MKKVYRKPEISFEDFSLTTNIAAGCGFDTNLPVQNSCGVDMGGGMIVFVDGVYGCTTKVQLGDDGTWNGMCYHVPIENNNVFNS